MAGEINYKQKYIELKAKYMQDVDTAFRLGFEEGSKQGQLDSANQQLAQANAQNEAAAGGQPPGEESPDVNNNDAPGAPQVGDVDKSGAPSSQPNAPVGPAPISENPDGSELDKHIATLEAMLGKSELPMDDLKKSISDLKSFQKEMKIQAELKKSAAAIPAIARALHKPQFKLGVQANHNLNSTAKAAVTMQHKIVSDVLQKWEQEEAKASKDILSRLSVDGITKGE